MGYLLKLPPKLLLNIAGYLAEQSDCLALSLTCHELQIVGEQKLYSNLTLQIKRGEFADNRVELLYRCLTSYKPRCEWVRRLSVTVMRPLTSRESEWLSSILRMLPLLGSFKLESSSVASIHDNLIDLRPLPIYCMSSTFSLCRLIWLSPEIPNKDDFISSLRLHRALQHLEINEDNFEVPKMGIDILPNLEVIRAPIATVLRLLPGRQIRRIKTTIDNQTSPIWMGMSCLDLEKVRTFSSTVYGGPAGVELHESLIQQMGLPRVPRNTR